MKDRSTITMTIIATIALCIILSIYWQFNNIPETPPIKTTPPTPFTGYKATTINLNKLKIPTHKDTFFIPVNLVPLDGEPTKSQHTKWERLLDHTILKNTQQTDTTPNMVASSFNPILFVRSTLDTIQAKRPAILKVIRETNQLYTTDKQQRNSPEFTKQYKNAATINFDK